MTTSILSAVKSLCADMVAPPLEIFKAGDIVISRAGHRYRIIKVRGSKDMFRLQCNSNLQVCHGMWNQRQLEIAGVKRA